MHTRSRFTASRKLSDDPETLQRPLEGAMPPVIEDWPNPSLPCRPGSTEGQQKKGFRIIFYLLGEVWPTRESFGMPRGPRFWPLGVDYGPRGGAFEGFVDPKNNEKHMFFIGAQTVPTIRS